MRLLPLAVTAVLLAGPAASQTTPTPGDRRAAERTGTPGERARTGPDRGTGPDQGRGRGDRPFRIDAGPPTKAAHFRVDRGDSRVEVKCPEDEPMRACVEATIQLYDRISGQR